jgi:hypothetical protein
MRRRRRRRRRQSNGRLTVKMWHAEIASQSPVTHTRTLDRVLMAWSLMCL